MFWLAFLFLIAALPWALPVLMRVRVLSAVIAILVLGTVFGPAFFAIQGPISLSLDRIAWAGVMLILTLRLIRRSESIDHFHRLDFVAIGLVIWVLLSCLRFGLFSPDPPPVARWLFYIAMPATLYMVARTGFGSDGQGLTSAINALVTVLVVLGTYLSITAVFEVMDIRSLVFPRFINDPDVWEFYGRGRGPLLNPAGNGILMTLGLTACVIRFFSSGRYGKVAYGLLAVIALAGCYATLTRSVWCGAALSLAILGMLYVPMKVRVVAFVMTILFAGAMTLGLKEQLLSFKRDKALSASEAAKSVELRPLLATVAWEMFLDRPLAGHGFGQYLTAAEPYHAIRSHGIPLENVRPYVQHNVFLSLLVDIGLIGLTLHVLFVFSILCMGWQLARTHPDGSPQRQIGMLAIGILSGYFCNGMFHDVSIIEMVHTYLFTLSGLTVTVWVHSEALGHVATSPPRRHLSDQKSHAATIDSVLVGVAHR
ncbi:O-antigen ligase family protein [Rhodopirellula sp. ICT_H3.1]|uniref:O-antigen ligase family protein n=1 Tax=Aporhodopirellula aestuarii TaxID=2950107 RepID=A0ABT0U5V3_9BACT|nr:O-antigen ligase family protein [Aporhodopirellula aestuarii]MCM2372039.1 O-antigen ligase family protein [Aporhodopirellula aestuarii]